MGRIYFLRKEKRKKEGEEAHEGGAKGKLGVVLQVKDKGDSEEWVWVQSLPGHTHPTGGRGPGLLLLIALTVYTSKNAWKPEVFFSWSYFFGWLALPFSFIAGNQHEGKRVETIPLKDSPSQKLPSHLFSQESPQ